MKTIQLRPYQSKAIESIKAALNQGKEHFVVEMAAGCGKGTVFAKTIEFLQEAKNQKILVVVDHLAIKKQILSEIATNYSGLVEIVNDNIVVETATAILKNLDKTITQYGIVIFYDAIVSSKIYDALLCEEKTVIVFTTIGDEILHNSGNQKKLFSPKDIVFSYTFQEAINDGYMTPAMDTRALEPAIEVFSKQLLEQFGCVQVDVISHEKGQSWDLILQKGDKKLLVECKSYKSQVVSPFAANELLKTVVMKKMKQNTSREEIILLIVLSSIPSFQKEEIFQRYRIIVWDIDNLVFYSKSNPALLKQLSQITYFPIDHIEGSSSAEAESINLVLLPLQDKQFKEAEKEANKTALLIKRLNSCAAGRENSREYEEICEDIIRHLFEANYFNRLTSQHKTNDEHFRMDLIGALKITQNNDESTHPLWQMLVQHYNSHFVVFEFKNYTDKIAQNLIYITEKYLFDAALRNVAFIISRKGFSDAAKFAAESCLKEHGKLILDVTQDDLMKMLKSPSDNPADHLLTKLEEFLMGISK